MPSALKCAIAGRRGETREGAADLLRHAGVALREAADVHFGDRRPLPGGRAGPGRCGLRLRHDGLRHGGAAVAAVGLTRAGRRIEHRVVEDEGPVDRRGIGVEQQLRLVEAMAVPRLPGAAGPKTVARAGLHAGDEAVMDVAGALGQRDARLLGLAGRVVEAEDDLGRMGREDRDIDAALDRHDAERPGPAGAQAEGGGRGDLGRHVVQHRPAWVVRGSPSLSTAAVRAGRCAGANERDRDGVAGAACGGETRALRL